MNGKKAYCISHVKDVDGIASAALVLAAKEGAEFKLTEYNDLFSELDAIPASAGELVLCDLGTDPGKLPEFTERLAAVAGRMKVTYIDHHYLTPESKAKIRRSGVRLVHNPNECSGVLTYRTFREALPQDAKLLALYAAVTDYMDGSSTASRMMERFDRQYVLLESTLLAYAVANRGGDYAYLSRLVRGLAGMGRPHAMEGVHESAIRQAERMTALAEEVRRSGVKRGKISYMETDQHSTGNVAKLLLGAFDAPLAIAYRERRGRVEMSLRCTSEVKVHLGRLLGELALKYRGNGGGHRRAAGCTLRRSKVPLLMEDIERALR